MFLQTLASTGGDLARTAKLLGVQQHELRDELIGLLDGLPVASGERAEAASAEAVPASVAKTPAARKASTKKR
jgi:hypothetical protein